MSSDDYSPTCIFFRIVSGAAPASLVYQDERCVAFMDIQPVNTGHWLIVPLRHAANLAELEAGDGERLFRVGQNLTQALRTSGLRCEGVNMFLADGEAASSGNPMFDLVGNELQIALVMGDLSWRTCFYEACGGWLRFEAYKTVLLCLLLCSLGGEPNRELPDSAWLVRKLPDLIDADHFDELQ
jgi:HIT domain